MMDKLTQKSQEALQAAQELARARSHQELDGPHLALALVRQGDTICLLYTSPSPRDRG